MDKVTKYATFDALKRAESNSKKPLADKENLKAEAQQAAVILHKLRAQRQQRNAGE